jgi:hypothetical protein
MTRLHEFLTKLNFRTILSFLSYSSNKIGLYIEYEYVQRNLLHNLFLNATLLRVDKLELWGDEKNERKDDAWKLSSPFGVTKLKFEQRESERAFFHFVHLLLLSSRFFAVARPPASPRFFFFLSLSPLFLLLFLIKYLFKI